ncbi:hypothetical protein GMD78_11350 [Ornithinibacillus sp. L9]|uniref:ABC-2 transporter permease n=1 Tax=Ornithinibacillus caprae TaxID=2678566 RepID=A0A6N8FMJ5_9BACI|nr:ABC-2 transporter permease [Ornithinibacillus caprae]MUK88969.1 hypothetical protein [Ornithinibacillus caprae]
MAHLLRKELQLTKLYILFFILLIPFTYGMNVQITGITIWIMIGFMIMMFYSDSLNEVYRYIVSVPIKRDQIVCTRYIFLLILSGGFSLYLWLIDYVAHIGLPFLEKESLSGINIFSLFTLISIIFSASIPLFYYIKSFHRAMTVYMVLVIIVAFFTAIITFNPLITFDNAIIHFVHSIIEIQPFIILGSFSMLCLFVSYKFSAWIFIRRDII